MGAYKWRLHAPVMLPVGRIRSDFVVGRDDGRDPMIFHSGNGILSDCYLKRAGGIDHAVHVVARVNRLHAREGEAYVLESGFPF
jgi:hypothetical protein